MQVETLTNLAEKIRSEIIEVMSVNGGHLASNLGSVELTIALHHVFSSPEDKFLFDVSHQTYAHKLLTDRKELFSTIRKFKGLSGFAHPKESIHDHFFAGHAGTALSLALGMAKNRDLTGRQEHVIAILGDASLTCGLTLEALNNIPSNLSHFIVLLNDNDMSISPNVGAVTELKDHPSFFEQFHLAYTGPIDGHDLSALISALETAKEKERPILLHIKTTKGKGMECAEKNPLLWHGCKPSLSRTNQPTFPQIFGRYLLKMAERDPSLVAITPATAEGSCLTPFLSKFPERCIDVGIAEGHAVTFAGAVAWGKKMKVVCSIYSTFLQRAFDNLFHDVCLQELPVLFAIDRAGLSGPDGCTHHGIYDISFLSAMPNMVICQPRSGHLLKELLESAFSWGRPTAIRYPNAATDEPSLPLQMRELGIGEILAEGTDLALLSLGTMCTTAMQVRDLLEGEGISAAVVDPIFIKPLDSDLLLRLLTHFPCLVTLEEHSLNAGFGSLVNSFVLRNGFTNTQVLNFGIPDTFCQHGSHQELMNEIGLTPHCIAKQILTQYSAEKVLT